ncbi:helix-turn-helix transcriptional regulator [Neorhizobium sp. Rsf11]|uniref:Helix-turn-helix transcriptional regulator n=1 Tax=Neorhizobium phenanthreniclasticum TaxID=3157917 RepID=A0ABV0LW97_9HYPH
MAKNDMKQRVGAAIQTARKRRGLVQRNIADPLGTTVAAVGMWESGKNLPSTENLIKTAEILRVDPAALGRGEVVYLDDVGLADAEVISDPGPPPSGPMDVKVMGVTYGGDDGDFTFNGEIAGYVRRPAGIATVPNVFALHVLSDSMVPRYDPGEVIYCGGRDPIPGDHVVIETFPDQEGQVGKSFIKKLLRRTGSEIIVQQYNPPAELTFDRYAVKNLWRVIPLKELIGF